MPKGRSPQGAEKQPLEPDPGNTGVGIGCTTGAFAAAMPGGFFWFGPDDLPAWTAASRCSPFVFLVVKVTFGCGLMLRCGTDRFPMVSDGPGEAR